MASATRLEYATACTTVFAPSTTSPLANTPGRVVWPSSSVTSRPRRSVSIPFVVLTMRLRGPWLMDTITLSAGYSFSVPGASMKITPSSVISTGALQYSKFTPSSVA